MPDADQIKKDLVVNKENRPALVQNERQVPSFIIDQKFEIAKDGIKIGSKVLDLAGIYLQGQQLSQQREDERETLLLEIEQVDKEAAAYCRKLEADMGKVREGTERLRIICDFLKTQNCPDEAINNLIINFSSVS